MAAVEIFHYHPGCTFLHQADPRVKIGSMLLFSLAIAVGKSVVGFSALTFVLGMAFVFSGFPLRRLFYEFRIFGWFIASILILYSFTILGEPLYPPIPGLTMEGLIHGLYFVWKIVLVLILGVLITGTTAPEEISEAITSLLRPIPGVPAARIGTMISLIFVMVPLILDQSSEMLDAQRARNISLRKNPIDRIRYLAIPLLSKIFDRAEGIAEAMEARCFSDSRTETVFNPGFFDWLFLLFGMGMFLLVFFV